MPFMTSVFLRGLTILTSFNLLMPKSIITTNAPIASIPIVMLQMNEEKMNSNSLLSQQLLS